MKKIIMMIMAGVLWVGACSSPVKDTKDIESVKSIDLSRYLGTWYEIARMPSWFEDGLVGVTANYTLLDNGEIRVLNKGFRNGLDGNEETAVGKAWIPDSSRPAELLVSFFFLVASDYKVFVLEENYQYAMVAGTTRNYLWILSRTPKMDDALYNSLVEKAHTLGFDTNRLYKVPQK